MKNVTERFPRAKLFAEAAQLHMRLEHWMNVQQQKERDMIDLGMSQDTIEKMRIRSAALEVAWRSAGYARQALYDCP